MPLKVKHCVFKLSLDMHFGKTDFKYVKIQIGMLKYKYSLK